MSGPNRDLMLRDFMNKNSFYNDSDQGVRGRSPGRRRNNRDQNARRRSPDPDNNNPVNHPQTSILTQTFKYIFAGVVGNKCLSWIEGAELSIESFVTWVVTDWAKDAQKLQLCNWGFFYIQFLILFLILFCVFRKHVGKSVIVWVPIVYYIAWFSFDFWWVLCHAFPNTVVKFIYAFITDFTKIQPTNQIQRSCMRGIDPKDHYEFCKERKEISWQCFIREWSEWPLWYIHKSAEGATNRDLVVNFIVTPLKMFLEIVYKIGLYVIYGSLNGIQLLCNVVRGMLMFFTSPPIVSMFGVGIWLVIFTIAIKELVKELVRSILDLFKD